MSKWCIVAGLRLLSGCVFASYLVVLSNAQELSAATGGQATGSATMLTVYNQDFAVARTTVPLTLHAGLNEVMTTNVTRQLEPDSVVLRDPESHNPIQVLEQNYDSAVVTQAWLLEKYEGQTIDFQNEGTQVFDTLNGERKLSPPVVVQGKIVRAGNDPLIEVNGKMQFKLPGTPLFPATTGGLLLKPTLRWRIDALKPASFSAELDYITHGMSWLATYNVLIPATEDTTGPEKADFIGWVTINNHTGTDFPSATIQLMAGDVAKIRELRQYDRISPLAMSSRAVAAPAPVTQKAFDEFHLYDLHRTVALKNGETKQVQFLEASGVMVERRYELDGADENTPTNVAVVEKIKNSESNHMGMPVPAGRLRVYRRDTDGQVQFVGENMIDHTAAEQEIGIVTGKAFDVSGTRKQTEAHSASHSSDESYEVKLSNQKAQAVTVHVIEHLERENWKVTAKSTDYQRKDAQTVNFSVRVPAKGEAVLTYSVHYSW